MLTGLNAAARNLDVIGNNIANANTAGYSKQEAVLETAGVRGATDLFSRTLLDTSVLIYRKADGTAVAMHDRCPHRFVPLSKGTRQGDEVVCKYHALRFDCDGKCTHNPHGNGHIPEAAKVQTYPLLEKYGFLWIWMGDEASADETEEKLDDDSIDVIVGDAQQDLLQLVEDDALLALPLSPRHDVCPGDAPAVPQDKRESPFAALKGLKN